MSSSENDQILMLHAPDGVEWAKFLAAKLSSESYNIKSVLFDITTVPPPSLLSSSSENKPSSDEDLVYINGPNALNESQDDSVFSGSPTLHKDLNESNDVYENEPSRASTASINKDPNCSSKTCNTADRKSGSTPVSNASTTKIVEDNNNTINRDSIQSHSQKRESTNEKDAVIKSIEQYRVCVAIISPCIVESESTFPISMDSLRERGTVFLLLGVELPEVMHYFGPLYDYVSRCRSSFIDGTEETIRCGIVTIIESYEDDGEDDKEDIYKIPNLPIQWNTIDKVFPRMLTETERDVYILLSRIPEDDVRVFMPENEVGLPLVLVCERLYTFTLPDNIYGEVNFQVECQGRRFGDETVHSYSKLDLVHNILTSEINPQSLIASSLGLDKEDIGGVDTALAFKLQQLASVMTFKALCPYEDSLGNSSTEEHSDKMWPTLLHFAADLNLRLLCSELLRYPGMVAAACTENRVRENPCQIASRKGHHQIERDLIQFMKCLQREVDPDYITSSQCNLSSKESSETNVSESQYTVTDNDSVSSDTYCDMTQRLRTPLLDRLRHKPRALSDSSLFRRKANSKKKYVTQRSADSGFDPSCPPVRTQSDRSSVSRSSSSSSRRPLPRRPDSPLEDQGEETYSNVGDSTTSLSSNQGSPTSLKALKRLGVTEQDVASRYSVVDPKIAANATFYSATCPPGTIRAKLFQDDDGDRLSLSSNCDLPDIAQGWQDTGLDPKRGQSQVLKNVKGFFHKMKGTKKTPSETDMYSKKNSNSKYRRGSEPAKNKKSSLTPDEERDSGSYSDEEKKPRIFKERNKQMNRRMSKRIETAKKDCYQNDAPQLPAQDRKQRETFKSFID